LFTSGLASLGLSSLAALVSRMATQSKYLAPSYSTPKGVVAAVADADDAEALLELAMQDPADADFEGLRPNLGMSARSISSVVTLKRTRVNDIIAFVLDLFLPLELVICWLMLCLPPRPIYFLFTSAFKVLVWLWAFLPDSLKLRGLGDELSTEAHVMSVLMWPSRLIPMTTRRIRFGMSSLPWINPPCPGIKEEVISVPEAGVKGLWLHTAPSDVEDPPVFMWIFGGAFFAGDCHGNRGLATRYAKAIGADVFLVDYRLLPEHTLEEGMLDGCRAYEWLCTQKAASKIFTGGISAGAGVLLRALQAAASTDPDERSWAFHGTGPTPQPAAALLLGPFTDFTIPDRHGSLSRNSAIDWMVTQQILRYGSSHYVACAKGKQSYLREQSPLYKPVQGLCPMHISYSLHEAVTDQCNELVSHLQAAGNDVETYKVKYLGHVFQALPDFLPEAREAELAATSWLQRQKDASLHIAKCAKVLSGIFQGPHSKGQGFIGG